MKLDTRPNIANPDAFYQQLVDLHQERDEAQSRMINASPVSYTHLRAHETVLDLVCRLLLEKKTQQQSSIVL